MESREDGESVWKCHWMKDKGMKDITNYKAPSPRTLEKQQLAEDLNEFYCRFGKSTSFLTDRQQVVRLRKFSSSTRTISTGAPQGCVLSPLLFSLYTNDCTSKDPSVKLLKFTDDTTLIGLIQDVTSLLTDRRLRSWLSGAGLTTWSLTRSKPWRLSWTSGETPLLSPHSPSWTALWLQWSHSDSWAPKFLRTRSETITLSP